MDLVERSILVSAIMTLMLASAMPLLLMPTLQPVEGQFLGDDDSALSGFNNTTTTNNEGLQLDLSATSNNNTLLSEYVKTIRFYVVPLLREAIEDRVGEENADNVRIVVVGFDGNTSHTTVGTNDTVSLIRSEFNSLPKASGNSTTAGFEITLDSSQCSSPSPDLANGECQFTIRLAQKANQAAEAAGGMTTIRPPEESGTIGLNDESEQNGASNNNDEIERNSISNALTNKLDDIFGDDNDNNDDSSSSDDNNDEIDRNSISNALTNKLDDIFG
jgi:hypothetical protein